MPDAAFTIKAVKGDMDRVAKTLKAAGTKEMRTRIRKIMAEETKPLRKKIKKSAIDTLPSRRGLNKWAASMPAQNTDFRERSAGVRIRMSKKGHDLEALNRGRLRHPLFGNRKFWYQQSIAEGFFTNPIEEDGDALKARIAEAIDAYVKELERKAN